MGSRLRCLSVRSYQISIPFIFLGAHNPPSLGAISAWAIKFVCGRQRVFASREKEKKRMMLSPKLGAAVPLAPL